MDPLPHPSVSPLPAMASEPDAIPVPTLREAFRRWLADIRRRFALWRSLRRLKRYRLALERRIERWPLP
jgi:hypothetical protein